MGVWVTLRWCGHLGPSLLAGVCTGRPAVCSGAITQQHQADCFFAPLAHPLTRAFLQPQCRPEGTIGGAADRIAHVHPAWGDAAVIQGSVLVGRLPQAHAWSVRVQPSSLTHPYMQHPQPCQPRVDGWHLTCRWGQASCATGRLTWVERSAADLSTAVASKRGLR